VRNVKTLRLRLTLTLLVVVLMGGCNNAPSLPSTQGDAELCAYFANVNGLITVKDDDGNQGVLLANASDEELVQLATTAHGLFVTYGGASSKAAVLARCGKIGAL